MKYMTRKKQKLLFGHLIAAVLLVAMFVSEVQSSEISDVCKEREKNSFSGTLDSRNWPLENAWQWYNNQPWPCGFNYIPANAISYTEMFWMPYCFDPKFIDKELSVAEETGFNCLRVILPFVVWEHDPKGFKKRFDTFLSLCDKRGLKVMVIFFDDCKFGPIADPVYVQTTGCHTRILCQRLDSLTGSQYCS